MKKELDKVVSSLGRETNLTWSNNKIAILTIQNRGKSASIRLKIKGKSLLAYIERTDYNINYLKHKIRKELSKSKLNVSDLDVFNVILEVEDVLRTDEFEGYNIGDEVTLPVGLSYYSLNDSYIECEPFHLEEDYDAEYMGDEENSCDESTGLKIYSLFKIN